MSDLEPIPCDFVGFMDALKRLRKVEDLIVVRMNSEIPVASRRLTDAHAHPDDQRAKCEKIYSEIAAMSNHRVAGISHCLELQTVKLAEMQKEGADQTGIREVQSHHRLMKRELTGEKLLKSQVLKFFEKRCSTHYTPPPQT